MLETERLTLLPAPLALVQAVAEGRRESPGFPATVPPDWPEADLREFLPVYAGMLAANPADACWGVWLMIERAAQTVIGDIGFKGPPDLQGRVEIGYSVLPAWRRNGYATEAARGLVRWALAQTAVTIVMAECLAENYPSARVLELTGMRCLGQSGDLLLWEIAR